MSIAIAYKVFYFVLLFPYHTSILVSRGLCVRTQHLLVRSIMISKGIHFDINILLNIAFEAKMNELNLFY